MRERALSELKKDIWASASVIAVATLIGAALQYFGAVLRGNCQGALGTLLATPASERPRPGKWDKVK
jgi:hypothetical protein